MSRWNNNPANASLGIPIYDTGMYRLRVKTVKAFINPLKEGKEAGEEAGGVRAVCTIVGGENDGKPYIANLYQHTEGARNFSKGFVVAAYGFSGNVDGEKAFNELAQSLDWTIDPDADVLGEGWQKLVGRELNAELGVKLNEMNQQPQQTAKYFQI